MAKRIIRRLAFRVRVTALNKVDLPTLGADDSGSQHVVVLVVRQRSAAFCFLNLQGRVERRRNLHHIKADFFLKLFEFFRGRFLIHLVRNDEPGAVQQLGIVHLQLGQKLR